MFTQILKVLWLTLFFTLPQIALANSSSLILFDHPLTGKIYSVKAHEFISLAQFKQELINSPVILLGETHDNPIHHRQQLDAIQWLIKANRKPSLAFEMLDNNQSRNIQTLLKDTTTPSSPQIKKLLSWEKRGWKHWQDYYPLFHIAIKHQLNILPANYSLDIIRGVAKKGQQAIPKQLHTMSKLQLSDSATKLQQQDIIESHCNMLPKSMIHNMALAQQVRDKKMALTLSSTQTIKDVVLIAGVGHSRTDIGAPFYLRQLKPQVQLISIAMMEVSQEKKKAKDYVDIEQQKIASHDYLWFTARVNREDPCQQLRKKFSKHKKPAPPL